MGASRGLAPQRPSVDPRMDGGLTPLGHCGCLADAGISAPGASCRSEGCAPLHDGHWSGAPGRSVKPRSAGSGHPFGIPIKDGGGQPALFPHAAAVGQPACLFPGCHRPCGAGCIRWRFRFSAFRRHRRRLLTSCPAIAGRLASLSPFRALVPAATQATGAASSTGGLSELYAISLFRLFLQTCRNS